MVNPKQLQKTTLSKNFLLNLLATSIAISSNSLLAQQNDESVEEIEKILITGSHIERKTSFKGAAPVHVVSAVEITAMGATQVSDILKSLTMNYGSEIDSESDRSGTSGFNIRGLGSSSTLTLVNGRRAGISTGDDGSGNSYTDMNQFPIGMIERIEVLTDGASATYGSDAVAGVVNIITRKGWEGFEVAAEIKESSVKSGNIDLALGHNFDEGSFNFYATYYQQDRNKRSDFDWLDKRIGGDGDISNARTLSATASPSNYKLLGSEGNGIGNQIPDPDCEAAGGVFKKNNAGVVNTSTCRHNFLDQVSVVAAEQRVQAFFEYYYHINDDVTYTGEAHYSHNVTERIQGAPGWRAGNSIVPGDHPFNFFIGDPNNPGNITYIGPENWNNDTHTGADIIANIRPLGVTYDADQENELSTIRRTNDNIRMVNDLSFALSEEWQGSIGHTYSVTSSTMIGSQEYYPEKFRALVNAGTWNVFGTSISDPSLISPKDGLSVAGNADPIASQIVITSVSTERTEQSVVDAIASGELFEYKGGFVSAAFGAQYRWELEEVVPDSFLASGLVNNRAAFPLKGERDVMAAFAETVIPFDDYAEIQLALRYEDHGDAGNTTDPKIAGFYRPIDWLNFRASWGTSFQAPTLRQTSDNSGGQTLNDPVQLVNGVPTCTGIDENFTTTVNIKGAPGLKPQESENFNFGIGFRPANAISFSADYWNYKYENLITQDANAQSVLSGDCVNGVYQNDPRITRSATAQVAFIDTYFVNIGEVKTDGIDMVFEYALPAKEYGDIKFDVTTTWVNKFEVNDGETSFDGVGSRNFNNSFHSMPEWRGNAGITWSSEGHQANLTVRYIDSYTNDQSNNAEIESMTTVDVQYSLAMENLFGETTTFISIGANNLFDVDPPALRRADSDGNLLTQETNPTDYIDRPSYDQYGGHSIRGRAVYLRLKQSF